MKNYAIKKGTHSSKLFGFLPHFGFTLDKSTTFECKFDENCIYSIPDNDKYDINKLYGFSTSYFHHVQSARVGWRCLDGEIIQLLTYCYDNSVRIPEILIDEVKVNTIFKFTISVEDDHFAFIYECGDIQKVVMVKKSQKSWTFKYTLFSYFGGNKVAPHNMNIYLK